MTNHGDTKDLCCDAFFATRVAETTGYYCCEITTSTVACCENEIWISAEGVNVVECLEMLDATHKGYTQSTAL